MIFVNINTPRINNARRVKLLNKQVCGDSYIITTTNEQNLPLLSPARCHGLRPHLLTDGS